MHTCSYVNLYVHAFECVCVCIYLHVSVCVFLAASGIEDCLILPAVINFCISFAGSQYPDILLNIILDTSGKIVFRWD